MSDSGHDPIGARGDSSVSATEALTGVSVPGVQEDGLERARLTPMVAAALRTALDRLLGELPARRPLVAGGDDDVLEVRLDVVDDAGLGPAAEVLESAGGSLGPAERRPGAWIVRVPLLVERPTYLMLEQGTLNLAVPWHAVARVRMIATDSIEAVARRHGWAVLPRFADAAREAVERPVVVLARGLRRACLIADRLVWRLPAEPVDATPPGAQLARAVRTQQGELWRVVEPEPLLRDVWPMPLPAGPARPVRPSSGAGAPPPARRPIPLHPAAAPALAGLELGAVETPAEERPAGEPPRVAEPPVSAAPPAPAPAAPREAGSEAAAPRPAIAPAPRELGPEHVEPLEAEELGRAVGHALVAEDSITARIFLERLLGQRGFAVVAVDSARALRATIGRSDWACVFVDVDLPDARGAEHLSEVVGRSETVIALVRDAADETVAAAHGITRTLRKPFDAEALRRLLPPLPAA